MQVSETSVWADRYNTDLFVLPVSQEAALGQMAQPRASQLALDIHV